jgi:hypothetical protein
MCTIRLPGFTAGASLYKTGANYRNHMGGTVNQHTGVSAQQPPECPPNCRGCDTAQGCALNDFGICAGLCKCPRGCKIGSDNCEIEEVPCPAHCCPPPPPPPPCAPECPAGYSLDCSLNEMGSCCSLNEKGSCVAVCTNPPWCTIGEPGCDSKEVPCQQNCCPPQSHPPLTCGKGRYCFTNCMNLCNELKSPCDCHKGCDCCCNHIPCGPPGTTPNCNCTLCVGYSNQQKRGRSSFQAS